MVAVVAKKVIRTGTECNVAYILPVNDDGQNTACPPRHKHEA